MTWLIITAGATAVLVGTLTTASCSKPDAHACNPARQYWDKPHNFVGLMPPRIDVSLDRSGRAYLNGKQISRTTLSSKLEMIRRFEPAPQVFLQAEMGVSCGALEDIRDRMDASLECKKAPYRCAEGVLTIWQHLPTPRGATVS